MNDLQLLREGSIAHLVFNRPQARNAVTQAMWRAIPALLAQVAADPALCVLIVRGVDDSAFASGADIAEFEAVYGTPESARVSSDAIDAALTAIASLDRPVIAMIRGVCVGGGCSLALACDLRFAQAGARFAITPAKLGLAYSIGDTRRLIAAVGVARAKDLLFSGRLIDADEAQRIGLADRVIAADRIVEETLAFAATVQTTSRASHAATKRIVQRIMDGASDDDPEARRRFLDLFAGADFAEGYAAFLAKRKPRF